MFRPGVFTGDFHRRACEVILEGLQKIGIFKKGFTLKELFDQELYRVFFPHGVGHLLGLDVHDVGAEPSAIYKNLRSATTLKTGMVITAEPGIYFIEGIFRSKQKRKLYKKYVNWRVADSYYSVGGVRIEDNILITKTGYSNLTKLPKEIKDIEHLMK